MMINCEVCNQEFYKKPNKIKKDKHHTCSLKCRGQLQRLDLVGKEIGDLKVLEFHKINIGGNCVFKCQCLKCDKISYPTGSALNGGYTEKCARCHIHKSYVGEISGRYFTQIKLKAKYRKILFEITQADVWEQFLKQDRKCALSGIVLTWQDSKKDDRGTASIDRRDSNIGYTKENIQIVHKHINIMKSNHNEDYFIDLCKKVGVYRG